MKRAWGLVAVALQLLVLAGMAGEREWILHTGARMFLRTAPLDPRDLFRGDYVRLSYPLSSFAPWQVEGGLAGRDVEKGEVVYAPLELDEGGVARARRVSDRRPASGSFLRGRTTRAWRLARRSGALGVKYGIEQYYVEQGRGRAMEKRRGQRAGVQVPLEMSVAVGGRGDAVLEGHRWGRLGIGLVVERRVARGEESERSAVLELTLKNVSDGPLTLVILPDLCSFHLISVRSAPRNLTLERPECGEARPEERDVQVWPPGRDAKFRFDLNEARWWLDVDGERVQLGRLPWGQRFRLVYRSPSRQAASRVAHWAEIWHGELPSRAFHGRGRVD